MGTPYKLKITLKWAAPKIWRRVMIPDNATFGDLHTVIQIAMGWDNSHAHMFKVGDRVLLDGFNGLEQGEEEENELTLAEVLGGRKRKLTYTYDFGDNWIHEITVEKRPPKSTKLETPVCLDGERACPPEDCGGVPGYETVLKALKDPEDQDHDHWTDWIGTDFDEEHFDLDKVNSQLESVFASVWACGFLDSEDQSFPSLVVWLETNSQTPLAQSAAEGDEWRESAVELLETLLEDIDDGALAPPRRVHVENRELAKDLEGLLDPRGIPQVVAAVPELAELNTFLAESMSSIAEDAIEDSGEDEVEELDAGDIKRFFDGVAELYRAEPWTCLDGMALGIDAPEIGLEEAVISFEGDRDRDFAMMLFKSFADFLTFVESIEASHHNEDLTPPPVVVRLLQFERGASIPREVRRRISQQGLDVANARAFPDLTVFDEEGVPTYPTSQDHRWIAAASSVIAALVGEHREALVGDEDLKYSVGVPGPSKDIQVTIKTWMGDEPEDEEDEEDEEEASYDESSGPNSERWLLLSESARMNSIVNFHIRQQEHIESETALHAHSAIHMVVENQLATDTPPQARKALDRLQKEGLDRHDAVHAIGSLVSANIFRMQKSEERPFSTESYAKQLTTFDIATWHALLEDETRGGGEKKERNKASRKKKNKRGKRGRKRR